MIIITGWTTEQSRIMTSSVVFKHTSADMLLCNLTPKLFKRFYVHSFESEWTEYSPFTRNFQIDMFFRQSHQFL